MFDLPTLTETDRRRANYFRKDLIKMGFQMSQLSVYKQFVRSKERALQISKKVETLVPDNGLVQVIFITDKQYGMTESYYGRVKKRPDPRPDELLLF